MLLQIGGLWTIQYSATTFINKFLSIRQTFLALLAKRFKDGCDLMYRPLIMPKRTSFLHFTVLVSFC